jgi:hypothetical protein
LVNRSRDAESVAWSSLFLRFNSRTSEVIKTIVDDEAFPDYQIPKKTTGRKKRGR